MFGLRDPAQTAPFGPSERARPCGPRGVISSRGPARHRDPELRELPELLRPLALGEGRARGEAAREARGEDPDIWGDILTGWTSVSRDFLRNPSKDVLETMVLHSIVGMLRGNISPEFRR